MITSADEFRSLRISDKADEYTRAANDTATVETWIEVIDRYPDMRRWVAHNKNVPHSILAILADDPEDDVRCAVAGKRKLLEELQLKLAHDHATSVRAALARNPKATMRVLMTLCADSEVFVAQVALEALNRKR